MKIRSGVVAWSLQGVYLTSWATIGIVVWIPQIVGAWALYICSAVASGLRGASTGRASHHLLGASAGYGSFVRAMETVQIGGVRASIAAARHARPLRSLGQAAWATLVWYVILWPAGVIHVTPVELASSLASVLG
jgi:hypothetical protein